MRAAVRFLEDLSLGAVLFFLATAFTVLRIGTRGDDYEGWLLFGSTIATMLSMFAIVIAAAVWDVRRTRRERRATMTADSQ